MLFAHVVCPVVDRRAVGIRRLYHVDHHSGDIYLVTFWKGLPLSCLFISISTDSCGFLILLLKEGSDSVLSPELLPCFFRQVVDCLTSKSDAGHGNQFDFFRDHVAHSPSTLLYRLASILSISYRFYSSAATMRVPRYMSIDLERQHTSC